MNLYSSRVDEHVIDISTNVFRVTGKISKLIESDLGKVMMRKLSKKLVEIKLNMLKQEIDDKTQLINTLLLQNSLRSILRKLDDSHSDIIYGALVDAGMWSE